MRIEVAKNKKRITFFHDKRNIELHPLWLRERITNSQYLDQATGQRLYDPAELSQKLKIKKALIKKNNLNVEFTDGIQSSFRINEIITEINKNITKEKIYLWKSNIKRKPIFRYKTNLINDKDGYIFLKTFYEYGFTILRNTPKKMNFILKFANSIGVVRSTNFGKLFNVKTKKKVSDLAYTSHALPAHTDNPYRKPIPGIQILHCIKNSSDGGYSTLTDGFSVAKYMEKNYKNYFKLLSSVKTRYTYVSNKTILENWGETIELNKEGEIKKIRLSPRLDYVPLIKRNQLHEFYKARSMFIKLCNSKKFMIKFKLNPGDLMVMDNHRTLHGRTSYNLKNGERHLQGCYIDHDSAESKMKYLKKRFKIK